MPNSNVETHTLERIKITEPKMWTVVLHNDDFTPMDFVTLVLTEVFHLDLETAYLTMLAIHNEGKAKVGKFSKEVAETKADHIMGMANECEHPLLATIEEA